LKNGNRKLMREWAMVFRQALEFGHRCRENQPQQYEMWLIRAGQSVQRAIQERDEK
jgi:hypothetical protein